MVSRRCGTTLTATWIFACLLAAAAAHADPTSADRETARTLMQQGREARDKGDLKEALKRFKGADDIMHVPTTALEVARALVALGQLVEARDFIAEIRQIPAKPNEPAPFKEARKKADDLDASLNGRIPSLSISVTGAPDGATPTVSVDGVQLPAGALDLPRNVDPGHHVVAAKVVAKAATGEGSQEVDVREGEQKPVEVALVMTAVPQEPEPPAPEPKPEAPPPPTTSHSPTVLTWASVGLGGVGVAAGTVTGIMSLSKKSTLQGECPGNTCPPGTASSDLDSANRFATISTIAFIAAGVGAGVAVVTLIVGHQEQSVPAAAPPQTDSGLVLRPWIVPGAAGVVGRF